MTDQAVLVALKCPNCAGSLNIRPDMLAFACGYCGANVVVKREGGTISLGLEAAIAKVQRGTDKTAAELAIKRLVQEIGQLKERKEDEETGLANRWAEVWRIRRSRDEAMSPFRFSLISASLVFIAIGVFSHLFLPLSIQDRPVTVGFFVAVGVAVYLHRRTLTGRALGDARRDAEMAREERSVVEACNAIDSQIEEKQRRLAENRAIVDS